MSGSRLDQLNAQVATLYQQGRLPEATEAALLALQEAEGTYGLDHPDAATSLNNLAMLYRAQGRYVEAEPLCQRALGIYERALGADHARTATGLNNLASLYHAQGRYAEAESLLVRALGVRERARGCVHPTTGQSANNLAALYLDQGRYSQAEPLYLRALAIRESALGPDHADTATSINGLAEVYRAQGRYAEAEPLQQRALAIREHALGADHPATATSINNLALLYEAQGRTAEAEPLLQRALAIRERALGAEHPDTAAGIDNLASLYAAKDRYAEAELLHLRALAIRERALGLDHPDTVTSVNNLGWMYEAQGRYAEAEPLLKHALAMRERALGAEHPLAAGDCNNLAALYVALGRYAEAEPLHHRALAIREKALGPDHPDTALSLKNLAVLYQKQGGSSEALVSMQRALEIEDRFIARNVACGSESARAAFLTQFTASQDAFLSLLLRALPDNRAVAAAALDRILRRKAIGAEVLAAQRDAVLGGRYPALAPRLKELQLVRAQIAAKTLAGPGAEDIEQHRAWLAQWNVQRDAIEAELARQIPEMNLDLRLRGVDRAAVAKVLPAGSALIEYVRFTEFDFQAVPARGEKPWKSARYLAFVLRAGHPDEVALLDLGEAGYVDKCIAALREAVTGEIERQRAARTPHADSAPSPRSLWQRLFGTRQAAEAAAAPIAPPDPANEEALLGESIALIRACGEAVRAAVFDPLRPALGEATQLFVSPDGDLYRLPFEILPAAGGQYLIDACRISYLGAGRDLLRFGARQLAQPAAPLVLADPDFDLGAPPAKAGPSQPAPRGRRSRDLDQAGLHFDPLPEARKEGEQVADVLGTRPWLAERCLESDLKASRSPRILHLATHGFFLADQEVSPEQRSSDDLIPGNAV